MMILLGVATAVVVFEVLYHFQLKHARKTKSEWYPDINAKDGVKYIDVGQLTKPQVQVLLEDIKEDIKNK